MHQANFWPEARHERHAWTVFGPKVIAWASPNFSRDRTLDCLTLWMTAKLCLHWAMDNPFSASQKTWVFGAVIFSLSCWILTRRDTTHEGTLRGRWRIMLSTLATDDTEVPLLAPRRLSGFKEKPPRGNYGPDQTRSAHLINVSLL